MEKSATTRGLLPKDDARVAGLGTMIDYAGLFPPASLDMAGAVDGYRRARLTKNAWILGTFVCPAARLGELADIVVPMEVFRQPAWQVSVLLAPDRYDPAALVGSDAAAVRAFQSRVGRYAEVFAVEIRLPAQRAAEGVLISRVERMTGEAKALGTSVAFFEVAIGPGWEASAPRVLEELATVHMAEQEVVVGAKLRTGGVTADAFPTVEQVALFVATCRDLKLPFKATAGLHHPFRHTDPVTGFDHHGFVNMLIASVLAHRHGLDPVAICRVLADEDPSAFRMSGDGLGWRDLFATADDVRSARGQLYGGFGSCDVDDPVADLVALGVLPVQRAT